MADWMNKIKVYVAGPLRSTHFVSHVRKAIEVGDELYKLGYIPFIPHVNFLWEIMYEKDADEWLAWDKEWLLSCDVLFRIPGQSEGADMEERWATENGIPVCRGWTEFLERFPIEVYGSGANRKAHKKGAN